MKNIYLQILDHQPDISRMVLATVTGTQGSTPQKPGSSALFDRTGIIAGTVGGGVVEGKLQKIAFDALVSKESGHFQFNLANDISKTEEAICGGQIRILVDANIQNSVSAIKQMKQSFEERIPGVLVTMVTRYSEKIVLINRYWMNGISETGIPPEFQQRVNPVVLSILSDSNQAFYREMELSIPGEEPSSLFCLEPVFPLPKLVIAGAGHIGRALAQLGNMLDFEVTVVDDRSEFANSENIPGCSHFIVRDIGEALYEIPKCSDTYVVIVTRGHKDDARALKACIGTGLAYTGMIGSKKKITTMKINFIENGWATPEQWDEIYSPIGIDIKSQTVEEIAVSIAAQLVLIRNSKK